MIDRYVLYDDDPDIFTRIRPRIQYGRCETMSMIGYCTDCPDRTFCTTLCKEAEEYANQDEVDLKELTIGIPEYIKASHDQFPEGRPEIKFGKGALSIALLLSNIPRKRICELLLLTPHQLALNINQCRNRLNRLVRLRKR